jgi:hypothetical protein
MRHQYPGLRLPGANGVVKLYIPSTTVASDGVASAPSATILPWGREADSSTAGDGFSSIAALLCSSPSQDRSVDFLHSTKLVVNQVRLPSDKYYSGNGFHLQARPDNSHGQSAKYAGNVDEPGFRGRLLF